MTFARVAGSVVAETRSGTLGSSRCLLVEVADESGSVGADAGSVGADAGSGGGEYLVAVDLVGANRGELVLLAQGSSCRWHAACDDRPIDTVITAIVDTVDRNGTVRYEASADAMRA